MRVIDRRLSVMRLGLWLPIPLHVILILILIILIIIAVVDHGDGKKIEGVMSIYEETS